VNDPVIPPVTDSDPVMPTRTLLPDIVWLPTNAFDPVDAKTVEFNPSNRSALDAYEDVRANDAEVANDELTAIDEVCA